MSWQMDQDVGKNTHLGCAGWSLAAARGITQNVERDRWVLTASLPSVNGHPSVEPKTVTYHPPDHRAHAVGALGTGCYMAQYVPDAPLCTQ
jgi:hypothetical protein